MTQSLARLNPDGVAGYEGRGKSRAGQNRMLRPPLTSFRQDPDSAVCGSGFYEVSYAIAKAATADKRQTLRRSSMTLAGKTWTLDYCGTNFRASEHYDADRRW